MSIFHLTKKENKRLKNGDRERLKCLIKGVVRKERVERQNSATERAIRKKNTLQDRIKQADLVKWVVIQKWQELETLSRYKYYIRMIVSEFLS